MVFEKVTPAMVIGSISVSALRSVGDVERRVQVVDENADDLAKPERDDREVIAAQLQNGRPEHDAEKGGDRGSERHHQPDRQMQTVRKHLRDPRELLRQVRRSQQRVHIGADRIKGDVAEVEQAGEADDDVQAQRQHHVQASERENSNPCVTEVTCHPRQRH